MARSAVRRPSNRSSIAAACSATRGDIHPFLRRCPRPWATVLKKLSRAVTHRVELGVDVAGVEAGGLELALDVAAEVLDAVRRDLDPEVLRGHVLQQVGLVQDDRVVVGDHRAVAAVLDREVGAEQVVVDHDEVRLQRALPHARHPAGIEVGAGLADAVLAGRGDLAPEVGTVGQVFDLAAVARLRPRSPGLDGAEERDLVEPAEAARLPERLVAEEAQVVAAALHDGDAQVAPEGLGQERDVLADELLLEVLGAGGDHDPASQLHGRQQVGQGLAGAGAGLGQEDAALASGPAPPPWRGGPAPDAPRTSGSTPARRPRGPKKSIEAAEARRDMRADDFSPAPPLPEVPPAGREDSGRPTVFSMSKGSTTRRPRGRGSRGRGDARSR